MISARIVRRCLALCLMSSSFLASACSADAPTESEPAVSGTLSLPLLANAGAHTYRLQGAMYLYGPVYQYLDLSPDTDLITATLPTGDYSTYLYSWTLTRDDGSGNFAPVQATLVSVSNPSFSIFNQATTTVSFRFETDGQLVTVGAGSLHVDLEVSEAAAACTPLGSDCAEGTWCAPSELMGAPLSCIGAGPLGIGEGCSSPADCEANSSCFDWGSGPVCAPLCPSADFGQACLLGGVCTPQGADYGVCSPQP